MNLYAISFSCVTSLAATLPGTSDPDLEAMRRAHAQKLAVVLQAMDSQCSYTLHRVEAEFTFASDSEQESAMAQLQSLAGTGSSPLDVWSRALCEASPLGEPRGNDPSKLFSAVDPAIKRAARLRITQSPAGTRRRSLDIKEDPFVRLRMRSCEITYKAADQAVILSKKTPLLLWSLRDVLQPIPLRRHRNALLTANDSGEADKGTTAPHTRFRWGGGDWTFADTKGSVLGTVTFTMHGSPVPEYCGIFRFASKPASGRPAFLNKALIVTRFPGSVLRLTALKIEDVDFHARPDALRFEIPKATIAWDIRNDKHIYLGNTRASWPRELRNGLRPTTPTTLVEGQRKGEER